MEKISVSDALTDIISKGNSYSGLDGVVGEFKRIGPDDGVVRPRGSDRMWEIQPGPGTSQILVNANVGGLEMQRNGLVMKADGDRPKISQDAWSSLRSSAGDPSRFGPTKEYLAAMGVHLREHAVATKIFPTKRRRGRPRKNPENTKVSGSNLDFNLSSKILDIAPNEVADSVWKIGMKSGVYGDVDDSVMIGILAEMEKRDRLAIGRPSMVLD
ncbi:glutamate-5-semialdehyde dehydrogenase [Sesbania bispinosa]|nr:glutamate-5-semialdehyde dehydrogenase [Sesbania bispinosa]